MITMTLGEAFLQIFVPCFFIGIYIGAIVAFRYKICSMKFYQILWYSFVFTITLFPFILWINVIYILENTENKKYNKLLYLFIFLYKYITGIFHDIFNLPAYLFDYIEVIKAKYNK